MDKNQKVGLAVIVILGITSLIGCNPNEAYGQWSKAFDKDEEAIKMFEARLSDWDRIVSDPDRYASMHLEEKFEGTGTDYQRDLREQYFGIIQKKLSPCHEGRSLFE